MNKGTESRLPAERLRPRIDKPAADPRVLSPTRYKAPPQRPQSAGTSRAGSDQVDRLSRGDVPTNGQIGCIDLVDVQQPGQRVFGRRRSHPAAHPPSVPEIVEVILKADGQGNIGWYRRLRDPAWLGPEHLGLASASNGQMGADGGAVILSAVVLAPLVSGEGFAGS